MLQVLLLLAMWCPFLFLPMERALLVPVRPAFEGPLLEQAGLVLLPQVMRPVR